MKRIRTTTVVIRSNEQDAFATDVAGAARLVRRNALPGDRVGVVLDVEMSRWTEAERIFNHFEPSPERLWREECVFTRNELDSAELLEVQVNRSPLSFIGAVDGDMAYDWTIRPTDDNPAPWCWQKTARLMKKKDMPEPQVGLHHTIPREILVHDRLLESVEGLKHKHIRLGPVLVSGEGSDWFQLMAGRVMPPYHEATTGIRSYRQKYAPLGSPRTIVGEMKEGYWPAYRRSEVIERFGCVPPVTFTWELAGWWGVGPEPAPGDLSHQNAPPQPALLVGQRSRQELIAAGVKRLTYVPVRWMD